MEPIFHIIEIVVTKKCSVVSICKTVFVKFRMETYEFRFEV